MIRPTTRTSRARALAATLAFAIAAGCAGEPDQREDFDTSGSREADQRAEQRIAKVQQMRGEGAGADAKDAAEPSLYERLGSAKGLREIVDDFVARVISDPRVNWERKGVTSGGVLGIGSESVEWKPTPENRERLARHLVQFLSVASGGPAKYEGRDMQALHSGMQVSNAEFDAAVGAMKATLDALHVRTEEQKELLAILESTRPQIAEKR